MEFDKFRRILIHTHETAATIQIAMVPVTTPLNVLESLCDPSLTLAIINSPSFLTY